MAKLKKQATIRDGRQSVLQPPKLGGQSGSEDLSAQEKQSVDSFAQRLKAMKA